MISTALEEERLHSCKQALLSAKALFTFTVNPFWNSRSIGEGRDPATRPRFFP